MSHSRVLFIIHDLYQDFNPFPLSVGYLAAVLQKAGHPVDVYCMDLYHYSHEELAQYLDEREYDMICIGFLAARFKETVLGLCHLVNGHKKKALLALGGHGPSPIPDYMLQVTQADLVAIGEAEETILELAQEVIKPEPDLAKIAGIAWRKEDKVVINPRRPPIKKLDSIPFPAWNLFPMDDYARSERLMDQPSSEKSFVMYTSRGCINRCNFCYRMEKGIRVRSIQNLVDELEILVNHYGIRYFQAFDEMFILNKRRVLELEKELERRKLEIHYMCSVRADIIDKEIVSSMKRSGCMFLNFGMEAADDEVLRLMDKNTTVAQNRFAVETVLKEGGIGVGLNFLWGNLGDNEASLRAAVDFIKEYNTYKQIRTLRPPTPYPGSPLYYLAIEKGLLSGPEDFFERFNNSDLYLVNFTDISLPRFYELLLAANEELITDHYQHTGEPMEQGRFLISQFKDLYEGKITKFRGARTYSHKK